MYNDKDWKFGVVGTETIDSSCSASRTEKLCNEAITRVICKYMILIVHFSVPLRHLSANLIKSDSIHAEHA